MMREFFGFGGYTREPEGYFSPEHLLFVGSLLFAMTLLAILFGIKNQNGSEKEKNRVLIACAILIDAFEIFKIAMLCLRSESAEPILFNLPLFLCSIQLITIPLAAFSTGRIKEASIDFVAIFGLLGAFFGTLFAGQNYGSYPVLSLDNVVSGITHCISGFAALYILIAKMAKMKKKNIGITFSILVSFCIAAYLADLAIPYNYMFLMGGDGTPYDILFRLVSGHPVFYPLGVVLLFLLYISLFYIAFYFAKKKLQKK